MEIDRLCEEFEFNENIYDIYNKMLNEEEINSEEIEYILFQLLDAIFKIKSQDGEFRKILLERAFKKEKQEVIQIVKKQFMKNKYLPIEEYLEFFRKMELSYNSECFGVYQILDINSTEMQRDGISIDSSNNTYWICLEDIESIINRCELERFI